MSSPYEAAEIYVGDLPEDTRERELELFFQGFGEVEYIRLKWGRGGAYAFVTFGSARQAKEAVQMCDGVKFKGCYIKVEFSRGKGEPRRSDGGSSRSKSTWRRHDNDSSDVGLGIGRELEGRKLAHSKFRVKVTGMPKSSDWKDIRNHFEDTVGRVCFADAYRDGTGVVEFYNERDMEIGLKLNESMFRARISGESKVIKLEREFNPDIFKNSSGRRSRSRSPL